VRVEELEAIASLIAMSFLVRRSLLVRTGTRVILGTVVIAFAVDLIGPWLRLSQVLLDAIVVLLCAVVSAGAIVVRVSAEYAWLAAAEDPIPLAAPFVGRWKVASGGPNPGRNHHQAACDQRFAYDFVRVGGPSLGEAILAPVAGRIAAVRDGEPDLTSAWFVRESPRPAGNYVSIETERGSILLCHLQCGSILVNEGDFVEPGTPLGRCGNSGRTSIPHLHIHAQNVPRPAIGEATGIPIAFEGRILRYADRIESRSAGR
jgi:murein DD-endopeptidase MepM/ murein hydrolase activator NlpD